MTDCLYDGRRFQVLTLVDTMTPESPAIEIDFSLPSTRVVAVLDRLAQTRGPPKVIYVDNGPEFVAKVLDAWVHRDGVQLAFSRPGTPMDNSYIEALNGRLREECLDQPWFASLDDARMTSETWRSMVNTVHILRYNTRHQSCTRLIGCACSHKPTSADILGGPHLGSCA